MTPLDILQKYWGHSTFRPQQEAIISAVLERKDVLALLPTGGGKSVCFQVPAMLMEGVCIVITPLIALMKDQVMHLEEKGIPAYAIHSGLSVQEVEAALDNAVKGTYKFLYVSPERLETTLFRECFPEMNVCLIAVDEAHCISQWGYDFRPPYLRIAALREIEPTISFIALTASATPRVEQDILEKLEFKNREIFRQTFERPNLSFSVFDAESKLNKLMDILRNVPGSSIVYCKIRRTTKDVAEMLNQQGFRADYYHAGLEQDVREKKQGAWMSGEVRVMVCTNAFGMGIDKPDVRTVIHYNIPDCLENYYQEAGRGGRDLKKSYAVLLYHTKDIKELEALPDLRYPPIESIKNIYQSIADFLQIPVGAGKEKYFDFDINQFVHTFKLDAIQTINAVKVLEQEGLLSFNESIFLPAKISFTIDKDALNEFETAHPEYETIIKCLLRTYQGIFENRVSVFEKQIARICRMEEPAVIQQLQQLQAFGIIEYLPQKETPQLYFLTNRAPAKYLHFDYDFYLQRKKLYELGIATMQEYLHLKETCRSRFIAYYFGDKGVKDCGICDNCLKKKQTALSAKEYDEIEQQIYALLHKDINIKTLLEQLKMFNKEKVWQVINHLQNERKIITDTFGNVRLK